MTDGAGACGARTSDPSASPSAIRRAMIGARWSAVSSPAWLPTA